MLWRKIPPREDRNSHSLHGPILSWTPTEHYAMLSFMSGKRSRHQSGNKPGKWIAALAVPLFLLGTGLFSFLWNVPLNTLRGAHPSTAPPAIFVRQACSLENHPMTPDPSFLAGIQPFLEDYAGSVSNAGRLDFTSHAPQEVEIRLDGLSIGLSPSLAVFNFRTKYGFSMQTSKKPDATDRAVYQWLKDTIQPEEPAEAETALTQPSNGTGPALSNPSSSRKSCGTAGSSAKGATVPSPEGDPIQRL